MTIMNILADIKFLARIWSISFLLTLVLSWSYASHFLTWLARFYSLKNIWVGSPFDQFWSYAYFAFFMALYLSFLLACLLIYDYVTPSLTTSEQLRLSWYCRFWFVSFLADKLIVSFLLFMCWYDYPSSDFVYLAPSMFKFSGWMVSHVLLWWALDLLSILMLYMMVDCFLIKPWLWLISFMLLAIATPPSIFVSMGTFLCFALYVEFMSWLSCLFHVFRSTTAF